MKRTAQLLSLSAVLAVSVASARPVAAQSARSQTYAPAPRPAQTYQAPQQTYQAPQPTYNRPSGGGSGGGSSSYCYKEEGINGRYVCR